MTALKVIPWGDVIEAAPGLVKSARKMFTRSQQTEAAAEAAVPATGDSLQQRVTQLEASLAQMAEQQKASAQLIETLAEQNARVVQAIDVLRLRTRLLMGTSAVLALLLAGSIAWQLLR